MVKFYFGISGIFFLVCAGLILSSSPLRAEGEAVIDNLNDADLGNKLGGAWEVWLRTQDDPTQNCKMSFAKDDALGDPTGHAMQLDYDVDSENPAYNGVRTDLNHFDASGFKTLNLYVKGDGARGFPPNLKIELIGPDKRPSPYLITGITDQWQKFTVPLSEFWLIQDLKRVEKFVVVFADITSSPKIGTIYIDQVYFE